MAAVGDVATIFILWQRELKRYVRSRPQVLASLGQPLLYLLVLGFGLDPVFREAGRGSYLQFVAPGVIGMGVTVHCGVLGHWSAVGPAVWFPQGDAGRPCATDPDHVGADARRRHCGPHPGHPRAGGVLGGRLPPAQELAGTPLAVLFMVLIAIVFSALGTVIGSLLKDMQGFQLTMNFLVLPIFFLSGALYPLDTLPAGLLVATHLDPLSYGIDGVRGALLGSSPFGVPVNVAGLVATWHSPAGTAAPPGARRSRG